MLYFPRPYPDELLGSLIGRACREIGLPHKELVFAVSGERGTYSSIFLPSYLKQLSVLTDIDIEELVFSHSSFPYIVSFMPAALMARLKDLVLKRQGVSGGSFNSLANSVTSGVLYRRLCRQCVAEDLQAFGTSYWHRSHMLPAVYYCVKHGQALEETNIAVKYFNARWSYYLPHEVIGHLIDFGIPNWVLLEIACHSRDALAKHADYPQSLADWHALYRELAENKGYLQSSPTIASWQLARDLQHAYGSDFLLNAGCSYPLERRNSWPALMVRRRTEVPFIPVKHILLYTFLKHCGSAEKELSYKKPGKKPFDTCVLDEELSKKVKVGLKTLCQHLPHLTLAEFMTECGCWGPYRHGRKNFPKTTALVEIFKSKHSISSARTPNRRRQAR